MLPLVLKQPQERLGTLCCCLEMGSEKSLRQNIWNVDRQMFALCSSVLWLLSPGINIYSWNFCSLPGREKVIPPHSSPVSCFTGDGEVGDIYLLNITINI